MAAKKTPIRQLVPVEIIEQRIFLIRGHKVMLDSHLAELYQVETRTFNQAVRRNRDRFPGDFMFQLTAQEASALRSQNVILEKGRGKYSKYAPLAFTEQGVAMLSGILRSKRAAAVNIAIMRAFVRLRQILASHEDLAERLLAMEKEYDHKFKIVFDILKQLMEPPPDPPKDQIGFVAPSNKK